MHLSILVLAVPLVASCSGDENSPTDASPLADAQYADGATPSDSSPAPDGTQLAADAGGPDGAGLPTSCEGDCQQFTLRAAFGAQLRDFDRAYFGVTASAGTTELHVEAYVGGSDGCPNSSSPTPDYTLVVTGLDRPTSAAEVSARVSLLDFQGDLLGGPLGAQATAVTLTPRAASESMLAAVLEAQFADGTVIGALYATHCPSMDQQLANRHR